jgi:hypothetical protein
VTALSSGPTAAGSPALPSARAAALRTSAARSPRGPPAPGGQLAGGPGDDPPLEQHGLQRGPVGTAQLGEQVEDEFVEQSRGGSHPLGGLAVEEGVHERGQLGAPLGVAGEAAGTQTVLERDRDQQDDDQAGDEQRADRRRTGDGGHDETLPGGSAAVTRVASSRGLNGLTM